jgi:hypothetical protein
MLSENDPYVLFYTGLNEDVRHSSYIFEPVLDFLDQHTNVKYTFISAGGVRGVPIGGNFALDVLKLPRQPDVVVSFKVWWFDEARIAQAAKAYNIPVIMVNHGAMFVKDESQEYKRSIYPADIICLWGPHDYYMWTHVWSSQGIFIITGNPSYNPSTFIPMKTPELRQQIELLLKSPFALLLTPGKGVQAEQLFESALYLNKKIPVVAKCHPQDPHIDWLRKNFIVFTEGDVLLDLMYHCQLIISNLTSAFIPALYWEKPIFIHTKQEEGYHFNSFKEQYYNVFNFKSDSQWTDEVIENAVRPSKEHYEIFGYKADGKNAYRVAKVIMETCCHDVSIR